MANNTPPTGGDGVVDDVVEQVQRALEEAQIHLGPAREQLTTELRAAFRMVRGDILGRPTDPEAPAEPELSVVEGGRDAEAPRTDVAKPDLTVAPPDDGEGPSEEAVADEGAPSKVTPGMRWVWRSASRAQDAGRIRLPAPTDKDAGWHTIFRGDVPRPYRLTCDDGELELAIEGLPGERLRAGCSMDIEARLIRVRAVADTPTHGRFVRISEA